MHAPEHRTCMDAGLASATRRKILVLEKDEFLNSLLHLLLYREGYDISAITQPEHALAYIRSSATPELVFINHNWLLDEDVALLRQLRDEADWRGVPVIAMLNYFNQNMIEHLLRLGIDDYLLQPFEPGMLIDVVQKYTSNS